MPEWEILHYGAIEAEKMCVCLLAFLETSGNEVGKKIHKVGHFQSCRAT